MGETVIYDLISKHRRNGLSIITSIHKALQTANAKMLPYLEFENQIHVEIGGIFSKNIKILIFLADSFFVEWEIQSINDVPYIRLYSNK